GQERIDAIDILRGVAILGILVVNMGLFSRPEGLPAPQAWPNALILFFAQEKFKALFSFLFGLGLAVQMMRAEARGTRFLPLYARRLLVLFLIGAMHFVLLWDGDILHDYAKLAVVLLVFRRPSLKTLLAWAGALITMPALLYGLTTWYAATRATPPPIVTAWVSYETGTVDADADEDPGRVHASGSYAEIVARR